MLKIRDEVDLKELDKFGFYNQYEEINDLYPNRDNSGYQYWLSWYDKYDIAIRIDSNTKQITCSVGYDYNREDYDKHYDLLYDLIKADMVEKIND